MNLNPTQLNDTPFFTILNSIRSGFIKSVVFFIVCTIPCGIFWKNLFDILMIYPLHLTNPKPQLIYTNPSETVILSFQIAVFSGLILASPFLFLQIWKVISHNILRLRKRDVFPIAIFSSLFFIGGCSFCYFTLPVILNFLVSFSQNRVDPVFKIGEYFGFLLKLSLSFGIVFELPVVTFILAKMGLVNARFLLVNSRYAIVIIFILAAILTPPDVVSQIMLALPLMLLYLISILVALFTYKNKV